MICNFNQVKIFVTVPKKYLNKVRDVACRSGAGIIGNYSFCTFSSNGQGTFIPNDNARPFIGKNNHLENLTEIKLEMVCSNDDVKTVISAIRANHPYEEPAIDIVPLLEENYFK